MRCVTVYLSSSSFFVLNITGDILMVYIEHQHIVGSVMLIREQNGIICFYNISIPYSLQCVITKYEVYYSQLCIVLEQAQLIYIAYGVALKIIIVVQQFKGHISVVVH